MRGFLAFLIYLPVAMLFIALFVHLYVVWGDDDGLTGIEALAVAIAYGLPINLLLIVQRRLRRPKQQPDRSQPHRASPSMPKPTGQQEPDPYPTVSIHVADRVPVDRALPDRLRQFLADGQRAISEE
jgi:hypothetical protein